jgi:hypothetical protein
MKLPLLKIACFLAAGFLIAANAQPPLPNAQNTQQATPSGPEPRIKLDADVYNFGKVAAGEAIQHTFIVTNMGDAKLVINNVRPGCGCTTAGDWTKEIAPGKTGVIPIQIASAALHEGPIDKQVTVFSNDKAVPQVILHMRGAIWKPIEVTPIFAWLQINPESSAIPSIVVHISNKSGQPITLSPPQSADAQFTASLQAVEEGKEYDLTISPVPPIPPGHVNGAITIKTSLTNMPEIKVPVTAISPQPVVIITPPRISLPAVSLEQNASLPTGQIVALQATGPQALVISDVSVNAKDVVVKVSEVIPGRRFSISLTFPPGFHIGAGEQVALTAKSNYPQYSNITIPITQLAAPPAVASGKP